ncbi:Der GTPase-activating protein YihI [Thaumasiovibrio sp. DFM-14]|uniref:Der GTPase-activating protein YihI n=1 Tax=Thaumasiovibrio sp. DFM-14 TaxID=3384792 RepID=UPI00399F3F1C
MTRKKKGRKVGSEGPAVYQDKSVSKLDQEALARKKARKRKGLKSGSRHSDEGNKKGQHQAQQRDPRLGSKKPIPLIIEAKPHPKSAAGKKARKLSAEQELAQLENDAQLNVMLDRLENGEKLGAGMQQYVDQKLDRIEALMAQLGLMDEEQDVAEAQPQSDEERLALFDEFEQFDSFDSSDFEQE